VSAWVLRKGAKVARCSLVTHQLGWELRLITTDLLRSQVCRSSEEVVDTHGLWKAAMMAKGGLPSREALRTCCSKRFRKY
jgi:hypothetical protein